jgi:hypothetical protein
VARGTTNATNRRGRSTLDTADKTDHATLRSSRQKNIEPIAAAASFYLSTNAFNMLLPLFGGAHTPTKGRCDDRDGTYICLQKSSSSRRHPLKTLIEEC